MSSLYKKLADMEELTKTMRETGEPYQDEILLLILVSKKLLDQRNSLIENSDYYDRNKEEIVPTKNKLDSYIVNLIGKVWVEV